MEALLRDLLAYTQVGSVQRDPHWTDTNAVLAKVLENLQTARAEYGAEVTSDPLPSLPVNEIHLYQILQNLIGNALKYRNPAVSPRIAINVVRQDLLWLFSVRDNGIGIASDYHRLIFGLFKRLHTTHQYSGTGIGLAIRSKDPPALWRPDLGRVRVGPGSNVFLHNAVGGMNPAHGANTIPS